jgi:transcriptional regulator with XRE-family HTH domain
MTGEEVRDILKKNGIGLVELADILGISNQAFYSRFYAKSFRPEYLQQINEILGKDLSACLILPTKAKDSRYFFAICESGYRLTW